MKTLTRALFAVSVSLVAVASAQSPVDLSKTVVLLASERDNDVVYRTNLNLANPQALFSLPSGEFSMNACISANGRTIVVASRNVGDRVVHVRRIAFADGRLTSHVTLDANTGSVGFTPDGQNATYVYPNGAGADVFMMPVAGGVITRLTSVGDVSPDAPPVIAANRLYYCGPNGVIHSEGFQNHRNPRAFPAASYVFTVSPTGDTIVYETSDPESLEPEVDTLDTHTGFHDRFPLEITDSHPSKNIAISQDEKFVYLLNAQRTGHTRIQSPIRLNINTGRFTYPGGDIAMPQTFTTTAVNPNG